jgi:predicted glycosyltransferase involved in capsule biosynthesis
MKNQSISVLIAWKDIGLDRLENCLRSIRNQDYDPDLIRIVLVDGGSDYTNSNKAKKLCEKYNAEYLFVKNVSVWHKTKFLNIAIKRIETKYILICDIDIVFEKNYFRSCVEEIKENPFQVLYTKMLDCPENLNPGFDYLKDYNKIKKICSERGVNVENPSFKFGSSICFTLSHFFKLIKGYDEYYKLWGSEDYDLIKRFELLGLRIRDISERTSYLHQWHQKYEGTKNFPKFLEIVKGNKKYALMNNKILRNPKGWG